MQLAQDLCARMVATHPGDVTLGGVYGSTARGTDTRWSDLEMLFVVHDIGEIVLLAERLVHSFWRLLADEGIHVASYQAVDNLPL